MAIWLEIHCDIGKLDNPSCKSARGDNPGILTNSDRQGMMDGLYSLERAAKKQGWQKTKGSKWVCVPCQKERQKQEDSHDRRHFLRDEKYGDKRSETKT
jgi:hypothetical protein